ncbi:MAG: VCBS repeat-containing protein [bacterium]|nr:VCBS repeat-containing protein [bacterium]
MPKPVLVLLLASSAFAQSFDDDARRGFLASNDFLFATPADIDGDGDTDLFFGRSVGNWTLLRNGGGGRFDDAMPLSSGRGLSVGDFDGDGDLDFVTDRQSILELHRQQNGRFSITALPMLTHFFVTARKAVDLDGDGDLDLAFVFGDTTSLRRCQLLRNQGSGTFTDDATALASMPAARRNSIAVLDLQGDGRPDLVFDGNPAVVMLQNPAGDFTYTPTFFPFPFFVDHVDTLDIDADGDEDLIGTYSQGLIVLRNDGAGSFTRLLRPIGVVGRWTAADIDGNGDPELLTLASSPPRARLWRIDPGLAFVDISATRLPVGDARASRAVFLDSDGDGDQDLVLDGVRDILHNDGTGHFRLLGNEPPPAGLFGPAVADLDGDRLPDLVGFLPTAGPAGSGDITWWANDGAAGFSRQPALGTLPLCSDSFVRLADLDGDGRDDIWALTCGPDRVWHNQGNGVFVDITNSVLPQDSREDRAVVIADFDSDGDLDAFVPRDYLFDSFYVNQGNLTFVDEGQTRLTDNEATRGATAIDYDGDGDLDLALVNESTPLRLFENDGNGQFSEETSDRVPDLSSKYHFVLSGDIDGDHATDLVLLNSGGLLTILKNIGGRLAVADPDQAPALQPRVHWPQLVDFDRDGDLDLMTGDDWLRNDGRGWFSTVANAPRISNPGLRRSETLVDIDRDRDVDLLTHRIRFNLDRQLTERSPARTGLYGEVELHARPSAPGWNPFALLYTARVGVSPIDLGPLGDLRLDPASLTSLGFFSIPSSAGSRVLRYPVPAGSGLIGTRIPLQALVSNSTTELHTTNAIELRIDI